MDLQAILNYQEIDKRLYALERELAGCEERKEYVKAKKFLETAADKLDGYDAKATQLKNEAIELTKKYLRMEDTLKDFAHIDELVAGGADIAFYKKSALSLSDQLKKIKADLATLTAAINATHDEYQKLKKQVIAMQKQYKDAYEKYNAVKASKEGERKAIEAELQVAGKEIPAQVMEKYKIKRKEKVFPVVGKLKDNRCPFCGMEPPLAARGKLSGGGVIECENCRRIIYEYFSAHRPEARKSGSIQSPVLRGKEKFSVSVTLRGRGAYHDMCRKLSQKSI